MSLRRTKISIYIDILRSVKKQEEMNGEAKITRIIFNANLPYVRIKEKLDELIKLGFLEIVDGRYYRLTDRGRHALRELLKVQEIVEALGFKI